ncbi:MAG: hypothetical protein J6K52_04495 [Clostridia bacterium]|nr:hypothetical protein [Clostridia bacterium]
MGVYKNAFDAKDGTLKKNLVAKDMNAQGVSSNIRAISGTLSHKPVSTQETITESAREAKSVIERVIGERASVVITNDSAQNRAFYNPNEGVIYINNKADLSGEDVAKFVAMHEITHTTEGTKYYDELDLVTQVDEYFKTFNYRVYNKEVGKVLIDKRGIKDDIAHGIGRKKAATFAAVPDVIKNGKVVDYQKNWKGRGYDTAAIAAPIIIANEKHYMGVVVIRNKENNRFYVHEVATIKEEGAQPFKTSLAENNSNAGGDTPSIISILQNLAKNNPSYEKNSIYTKKGAVRSLVLQAIDSLFNDGKSDDVAFILNDAKNDIVSFSK